MRADLHVRPTLLIALALVLVFALPPLGGDPDVWYNENRVMWVGGALFLALGLILVVEIFDWLVLEWRRWRGEVPPPGPFRPGDAVHRLRPEPTELRRRYLWRPKLVRRAFGEGRTEADPESER